MARKLTLEDLKVQSFVTTVNANEAGELIGGTQVQTCDTSETVCMCTKTHECTGCTAGGSNCCETFTDPFAGCTLNC
jgi:hypothetical protein